MQNTAYTYNPQSEIDNNLKIFIGTHDEIYDIQAQGKVVNLKWYLAWDYGEIFIGNSLNKLIQFGGSNKTLSEKDITDLIEQNFGPQLRMVQSQLSTVLKSVNNAIEKLNSATAAVNSIKDIDNLIQNTKNIVSYAFGDEIIELKNKNITGVYISLSDSSDSSILKGHNYYLSNGQIEEL